MVPIAQLQTHRNRGGADQPLRAVHCRKLPDIGVDIGNDTFHLVGFDHAGQRVLRKKIKRLALQPTFEKLPRYVI